MTKKRKRQKQTTDFYAIEILDWDLDYGINFGPSRFKFGLDAETYTLIFIGKIVSPKKVEGRDVEARFQASRYVSKVFNEDSIHEHDDVNSVGNIYIRGSNGYLWISIPHDIISTIMAALKADKIRYITMFGEPLYRGRASIQWFNFAKDLSNWE
jgi:hypothetical protein